MRKMTRLGPGSEVGHISAIQSLDPTACNNQAINLASDNGHTGVVKLLLQNKAVDPTAWDNEAIREASRYGRTEVAQTLLNDLRVWKFNYSLSSVKKIRSDILTRRIDLVCTLFHLSDLVHHTGSANSVGTSDGELILLMKVLPFDVLLEIIWLAFGHSAVPIDRQNPGNTKASFNRMFTTRSKVGPASEVAMLRKGMKDL